MSQEGENNLIDDTFAQNDGGNKGFLTNRELCNALKDIMGDDVVEPQMIMEVFL